jgi:hypothetical protein
MHTITYNIKIKIKNKTSINVRYILVEDLRTRNRYLFVVVNNQFHILKILLLFT